MAADVLDQLSRLGDWLERESGDSLRPVPSTNVAQKDEIVVLEPHSDHSRRSRIRRWPVTVSAAAAVIVMILLILDWGIEEGTVVSDVNDSSQEVTDNIEEPTSAPNSARPTTASSVRAELSPDPIAVEVVADLFDASNALTDCNARTATAVQGDVVFCQLSVDTDWLRAYGLEDQPSPKQRNFSR